MLNKRKEILILREKLASKRNTLEQNGAIANLQEKKRLGVILDQVEKIIEEMNTIDFLSAIQDQELRDEIELEIKTKTAALSANYESLKDELLDQKDDSLLMEIRACAGGDEAGIFASDLLRMYQRYAEKQGWIAKVITISENEAGGLKSVTLHITGNGCYRNLLLESGVHRVQRIPSTEANGRIHTSTASVVVLREPKDIDIKIADSDLRIDVCRAGGAGGQHVNTTDSAVRITHLPTGTVVQCQDERSQFENKNKAMKVLKIKLYNLELQKNISARDQYRQTLIGGGERSDKCRTYNFQRNQGKDHRFSVVFNLDTVMNGHLSDLINEMQASYLAQVMAKEM